MKEIIIQRMDERQIVALHETMAEEHIPHIMSVLTDIQDADEETNSARGQLTVLVNMPKPMLAEALTDLCRTAPPEIIRQIRDALSQDLEG